VIITEKNFSLGFTE